MRTAKRSPEIEKIEKGNFYTFTAGKLQHVYGKCQATSHATAISLANEQLNNWLCCQETLRVRDNATHVCNNKYCKKKVSSNSGCHIINCLSCKCSILPIVILIGKRTQAIHCNCILKGYENVIVLMHRKHNGGHNIYKYGTPGVAYDFIRDTSTMAAPCKEGQLFLNLNASFCLLYIITLPET